MFIMSKFNDESKKKAGIKLTNSSLFCDEQGIRKDFTF